MFMRKDNITTGEMFDTLITVLINYDRYKDILQKTPHRRFLDLALVPVLINDFYIENSYEFIDNSCIENMDIDSELFMDLAYFNYGRKMGTKVISMFDYMKPFDNELYSENLSYVEASPDISKSIYILSNKYLLYGAAAMCNKELLDQMGRYLKSDYYIIPSSINELLIFPDEYLIGEADCKEMIKYVNTYGLDSPGQYLSDNLYKYDASEQKLYIA